MIGQDLVARIDTARALLAEAANDYGPAVLASSMGAEDMVLIDLISRDRLPIATFMLDTGRLHAETLELVERTRARYRIDIDIYRPDPATLDGYIAANGVDAIFTSIDLRKECCRIRKVEPLSRALAGKGSWVTGLRRSQSVTRAGIPEKSWDAEHGLYKFSPLAAWAHDDVWDYIRDRKVPTNPLHDKGFVSIGCAPCTRAIQPGEDERAGRWWWENAENRECGLHPGYFERGNP
jgi:phosphoadenosine phosphosulfate reductase